MKINHNIIAMNSLNRLTSHEKTTASARQKIASGLRINHAADDVAGSAISQKMKAQIKGLQQAETNIQNAVSMLQTAEGGLAEIENPLLQRLRELAVQAGNETLSKSDRQAIQAEIEQIKYSINDIANNTDFNGVKLLNVPETITVTKTKMVTVADGFEKKPSVVDLSKAKSITIYERTGDDVHSKTYSISDLVKGVNWRAPSSIEDYKFSVNLKENTFTTKALLDFISLPLNNVTGVRVNGLKGYDTTEVWASNIVSTTGNPGDGASGHALTKILGKNLSDYPSFGLFEWSDTSITVNFEAKKEKFRDVEIPYPVEEVVPDLHLQVGANEGEIFKVDLTDARTEALGIDKLKVDPWEEAAKAITKVDQALNLVSSERGKFGSYQNALEHILNNVGNTALNLTAANSRIEDADIAKEMIELTKSNILSEATQAMLSQANKQPETVLQLLKQ
jgi:flagellin